MDTLQQFYINGRWVTPSSGCQTHAVINPATEQPEAQIPLGEAADIDSAIAAATAAFTGWSETPLATRLEYLEKLLALYQQRLPEIADAISREMGAPIGLASKAQAPAGMAHLNNAIEIARDFPFEETQGGSVIRHEPAGVCALITPWNWPMNQIMCKLAPALAVGCTVVLKPSEFAALSANLLGQMIDEIGLPAGVFNMVYGDGAKVGPQLSSDPRIDVVSLTGSTRAGASVSKEAADTIKRVSLELGGKSANIVFADAKLDEAVAGAQAAIFAAAGQSCVAGSRLLIERSVFEQVTTRLARAAEQIHVGLPSDEATRMGPLQNRRQFEQVTRMIEVAEAQGARVLTGGKRPEGLPDDAQGYFIAPTVLVDVTPDMEVAQQEVFGPVLVAMAFDNEEEAIRLANDTRFGLAGAVWSQDVARAHRVAGQLRAGTVWINSYKAISVMSPFGGFGDSGFGRSSGLDGLREYTVPQSVWVETAPEASVAFGYGSGVG
nr:aldehyde dehydrogenase family protein [uncultured Halomonas sp.]